MWSLTWGIAQGDLTCHRKINCKLRSVPQGHGRILWTDLSKEKRACDLARSSMRISECKLDFLGVQDWKKQAIIVFVAEMKMFMDGIISAVERAVFPGDMMPYVTQKGF